MQLCALLLLYIRYMIFVNHFMEKVRNSISYGFSDIVSKCNRNDPACILFPVFHIVKFISFSLVAYFSEDAFL